MSSNTNIGNTPVNQGYVQLIHTGETGGIDGTLRTLYDGDGTASDLQIASNKVKVSTELYIGSKTATEFIQDIVGDMFTTGSYTNITTTYDDTNGNIDLSASGEVTLTGTQTLTNKTLASPTFTGTANGDNLTLTGDLTVSGDTIFTNSNNVLIGDAILTLNADETGSPTANAGFEVERGTSANKSFVWNETDDKWTIGSETFVAGTVEANLTGNVTGSASLNLLKSNNLSDLTNASTARTNLGVDAAGTDNSTNVTLAGSLDYITLSGQEITRNAINLTTDVTGTLPVGNGGTGLTSISTLLNSNVTPTSLGLVIGTDVQAQDTLLQDIADFSTSDPTKDGYVVAYDDQAGQLELVEQSSGISFNGSTANGLLTYGNSTTADVESNLTFDGNYLRLADNKLLIMGAGDMFQIGHKATYSQIATYEGHLYIDNNADDQDIILRSDDGSGGVTPYITLDGGLGFTTVQKLMRFSDNVDARFGSSSDLRIRHDGTNSRIDNYTGTLKIRNTLDDADITLETDNGSGGLTPYITLDGSTTDLLLTPPGNVGIGTSAPGSKLHIRNNSAADQLRLGRVDDDSYLSIGAGANNAVYNMVTGGTIAHQFQEDGDAKMTIQTNGNVGIGTNSPSTKLQVAGHTRISGVGNGLYFDTTGSTESNVITTINDYETLIATNRGSAGFGVIGNSDIRLGFGTSYNAAQTKLYINGSSGNVGIATTSPDTTLDITSTGANGIVLNQQSSDSNTSSRLFFKQDDTTWNVYGSGGALMFNSGATVGSSSGTLKFQMKADGFRILDGALGVDVQPSTTDGRIDAGNDVVAFSTSDKRLKENIKPLDNALDKVLKINGVSFDWKELTEEEKKTIHGNEGHDVGVIAQEIEEVLPEVVTERKSGYKAVKYEKIVPLLIEAIKEQQQQIEELKNG